jgi:hypothetical protein
MPIVSLSADPILAFYTSGGAPLVGGTLLTQVAGTAYPTYSDAAGATPLPNPIVLNSRGEVATASGISTPMYVVPSVAYTYTLSDSLGNTIWTAPNVTAAATLATVLASLTQGTLGFILYPLSIAEAAASVTPTNYWYAPGNVLRYGSNPTPGTTDMSVAIQAAITVARSGGNYISFPPGQYLVNTTLNLTLLHDVEIEGLGARQGVQILGGTTASWVLDCTGMYRCKLKNLFIGTGGTTTATGGILLARTNAQQALYNCFDGLYVQMYNLTAPAANRAIGIAVIGSEENTFHDCKVFANTPYIISTAYSDISAGYPSPYQNANIPASNSCGVNTWSGESLAVTFDALFPVFILNGCNTIDFGNFYCANINIGAPGAAYKCLSVIGGTLEGIKGQFKLETINSMVSIDQYTAQVMGWNICVTFGAGITATNGVFEINTGGVNVWQGNLHSFKLGVFHENPGAVAKPLVIYSGIVSAGAQVPSVANIAIEVNQTLAQAGGVPAMPSIFCGVVNGYELAYVDVRYSINAHKQIKRMKSALNLGACAASPGGTGAAIATITFPPIVASAEARAYQVRVRGMLSTVNEAGGGGDTNISMCPFETVVSGYSTNAGAITASAGATSDLVFTPVNSNISENAGLFLLTGVSIGQSVASRVLTLTGRPYGTGTNITSVNGYACDMEIEFITNGRINDLIYLT